MHGLLLVYVVLEAFTVCKVLEPLDDKYYKQIIYNPYSANSESIHIIQTIRPKPCTLAH